MTTVAVRYLDYLRSAQAASAPPVRGGKTKAQLKLSAVKLLEQKGYTDLIVSDIARAAKVSNATFYVYFEDKTDITLQVLSDFLEQPMRFVRPSGAAKDTFAGIFEANRQWLQLVRANAGLVRSLYQLSDQHAGFATLVQEANRRWYGRVAEAALRRDFRGSRDLSLLVAYSLGSMIDEICRKLVVQADSSFADVIEANVNDDEELAEVLAILWHRALLARDPNVDFKSRAAKELVRSAHDAE